MSEDIPRDFIISHCGSPSYITVDISEHRPAVPQLPIQNLQAKLHQQSSSPAFSCYIFQTICYATVHSSTLPSIWYGIHTVWNSANFINSSSLVIGRRWGAEWGCKCTTIRWHAFKTVLFPPSQPSKQWTFQKWVQSNVFFFFVAAKKGKQSSRWQRSVIRATNDCAVDAPNRADDWLIIFSSHMAENHRSQKWENLHMWPVYPSLCGVAYKHVI